MTTQTTNTTTPNMGPTRKDSSYAQRYSLSRNRRTWMEPLRDDLMTGTSESFAIRATNFTIHTYKGLHYYDQNVNKHVPTAYKRAKG